MKDDNVSALESYNFKGIMYAKTDDNNKNYLTIELDIHDNESIEFYSIDEIDIFFNHVREYAIKNGIK